MKKLLFLLCIIPILSFAQKRGAEKIILPIDSATNMITYQEVVKVEGATKDELYVRAREWFARSFKSSKSVIQMEDKEAGKIIGKGSSSGLYTVLMSTVPYKLDFTVSITVKEGRYRYEISPFDTQNSSSEGLYSIYTAEDKGMKYSIAKKVVPHIHSIGMSLSNGIKEFMQQNITNGTKSKDDF